MTKNNSPAVDDCGERAAPPIDENIRAGLVLIGQAYTYALDAGEDLWDFALEIDRLYETGLTVSDLRWLVAKGLIKHGRETSVYGDPHRSFRPSDGFNFQNTTCLVLTPTGVALADRVFKESAVSRKSTLSLDTASGEGGETVAPQNARAAANEANGPLAELKPCWDRARRELCLADMIVKRFRVPARNQEVILGVFEEEDWPKHIDDPLPLRGDIDPQTRLHDAINRLNGKQTNPLLRFRGNGHGTGVSWEHRNSQWPQKARKGTKTDLKFR